MLDLSSSARVAIALALNKLPVFEQRSCQLPVLPPFPSDNSEQKEDPTPCFLGRSRELLFMLSDAVEAYAKFKLDPIHGDSLEFKDFLKSRSLLASTFLWYSEILQKMVLLKSSMNMNGTNSLLLIAKSNGAFAKDWPSS